MFYAIHARSKSANRAQRFMDEDELHGRKCVDLRQATRKAEAFAGRLNQQKFLGKEDWRAEVEEINSPFRLL